MALSMFFAVCLNLSGDLLFFFGVLCAGCGPGAMDCRPAWMIAVSVAMNPVLEGSIVAVNVVPQTR